MPECPKCKHKFTNPISSAGGKASRRGISEEAQKKMQQGRAIKRFDKLPDGTYGIGSKGLEIAMKAFCPIVSEGAAIGMVEKKGVIVRFGVSMPTFSSDNITVSFVDSEGEEGEEG